MSLADYGFHPAPFAAIVALSIFLIFIVTALRIVLFGIESVGIYTMARKLKIRRSWFAFFPFLKQRLLGDISDGREKSTIGKIMMAVSILFAISVPVLSVTFGIAAVNSVFEIDKAMQNEGAHFAEIIKNLMYPVVATGLVSGLLRLVQNVLIWVALYRAYLKFNRKNAVLYLVLGLVFPFLTPFFVFSASKKDEEERERSTFEIISE